MQTIKIYDMSGKEVSEMTLSEKVFGITPNEKAVHTFVLNHLANKRQGTQSSLTRAEVRGGGKKPWRQKGTGRARQGSIRAPQWRKGGVVFAPKPRDYSYTINKKVKKLALKSTLSFKTLNHKIFVIDKIECNEFKTKIIKDMLNSLDIKTKTLMVLHNPKLETIKSARNLPNVKTMPVNTLNAYEVSNCDILVLEKESVLKLEEVYA